ncbi:MAG: hypothetical protein COV72_04165 [Candidatus Omnitrophica bacterium CG11_big_fil_rev_8_21_14_0_20_42_13]|uniref:Uridine phosphorylase n=1 Tax=Candidatus Ghiorseimicrobium undicola TaxID=1974746 RepID=A0A2H0LXW5_9BACT|nr:MAG: hypothetical protein COV72_04165 [Candidatus Omnitrophica bacterium CG11_big_fil_rev_8_21_14_0_20_42_13]
MKMKKDIHMTAKDLLGMLQIKPGDFGNYAIVPGPADRRDAVLKYVQNPVRNFSFMEYTFYSGEFNGTKITVGNGGRYSSDSAISAEILSNGGVKNLIRAGSCGALKEDIQVGDIIIATGAIRGDGVTPYYVKDDFKTTADEKLNAALAQACKKLGLRLHQGPVWTTDALLRETREIVEKYASLGAIAVDMVSSSFLTIAQLNNCKAASIMAVSDNVITGEMGFTNINYYEAEQNIIKVALEAIKILETAPDS